MTSIEDFDEAVFPPGLCIENSEQYNHHASFWVDFTQEVREFVKNLDFGLYRSSLHSTGRDTSLPNFFCFIFLLIEDKNPDRGMFIRIGGVFGNHVLPQGKTLLTMSKGHLSPSWVVNLALAHSSPQDETSDNYVSLCFVDLSIKQPFKLSKATLSTDKNVRYLHALVESHVNQPQLSLTHRMRVYIPVSAWNHNTEQDAEANMECHQGYQYTVIMSP